MPPIGSSPEMKFASQNLAVGIMAKTALAGKRKLSWFR